MPTKIQSFQVQSYGRSEMGLVRENNEDAWLIERESNSCVLCDGMGGHAAGEVAAQEAIDSFSCLLRECLLLPQRDPLTALSRVIEEVNDRVYSLSRKRREFKGMGTTLCCAFFQPSSVIVAHVGDSRVYLIRKNRLVQLTEDHVLPDFAKCDPRQAKDKGGRSMITRAIGAFSTVQVSIKEWDLMAGDKILLCSDGLTDMLSSREMEDILQMELSLQATVDALVEKAVEKGGYDNVTVILNSLQSIL